MLGEYPGNALAHQLKAQHTETLPYIVQYRESNFYFLGRLAAQYGEWLYYDGQTLRLGRSDSQTVNFQSNGVQQFSLSLHLQPGKTQGGHYNYRTHETLATQGAAPSAGHPFGQLAVQKSDEPSPSLYACKRLPKTATTPSSSAPSTGWPRSGPPTR